MPGNEIVYRDGSKIYVFCRGIVSILDAETGSLMSETDIGAASVYAFASSEAGVFISDDTLARNAESGFAWFSSSGDYRGRIALPDWTWVPILRFQVRGSTLYWCTIDAYAEDPVQYHHGFVSLSTADLVDRGDGNWSGTPHVIWQKPDPARFDAWDFALDEAGENYYLSLYEHSRRLMPESFPNRTYAAKVLKIDAESEAIVWEYIVHDDPNQDHGDAYIFLGGGGLIVKPNDDPIKLSLDGDLVGTLPGVSLGKALFVGDLLYTATGGRTQVNCIDARRFERLWTNTMPYSAGALPALYEGVLYVPGQAAIFCYDAATGKLLGTDEKHWGGMISQCSWSNTIVYGDLMIVTNGDSVFALRMNAHLLR